jgi:glutathione S-transferase
MSLVFYYAPWSSATTTHWALEELGVPYEKVKLDLAAKDTKKPAFLALNPNGKVPLLVHDGVPIFESVAILSHLGETFGVEKGLFPAPGIARAQAFQWLAWMNVSLGASASRFVQGGDATEARALLEILDRHLRGRTWMVGESFTLVDLHLAGGMMWIARLGIDTSGLPDLDAWLARAKDRPALARVMSA